MNDQPMTHELALDLGAAYVLGALGPAEEAAVREHLLSCPEPHDEFAELGGVVPYLAETVEQVEPPPALRDRIMAAAAADLAERTAAADLAARSAATAPAAPPTVPAAPAPTPAATQIRFPSAPERQARPDRRSQLGWTMRIAAVVAIVVLAGWNVLLQGQLDRSQRLDRALADVIAAAGQPGSQTVVLTPTDKSRASGLGAIRSDGTVVLAMRDLQATSGTQVYETWVIAGEGAAPVPVGSFTADANGTAAVTTAPTTAPGGSVIAVSLEPGPGSTTPLGPIVSTGVGVARAG